jgi:hypothetical protein
VAFGWLVCHWELRIKAERHITIKATYQKRMRQITEEDANEGKS